MKDSRVEAFRKALERLTESLDATARLARWDPADPVPEPLSRIASELQPCVELIERLAASPFAGSATDSTKMTAMRVAAQRLTAAYGVYREKPEAAEAGQPAAMALEDEVGLVRQSADAWNS